MRTYRSFAKINLHLEVVGRLSDGYHELRTVFQTISLCDRLGVALEGHGVDLRVRGLGVPAGPANLAHRAARLFLETWGEGRGVRLALDKRIPVGGGLGGGSSNAATVLMALRDLTGEPGETSDLVPLAARLGADVPFFLVGGTALGRGRGDEIEPLPDLDERELVLVDPGVGVPTAEVFASGRPEFRTEPHPVLRRLLGGEVRDVAAAIGVNDLEPAVRGVYEAVEEVYTALVQSGTECVRVSGSGAVVFALPPVGWNERGLVASLPSKSRVLRARTLSRASIAARGIADSQEVP